MNTHSPILAFLTVVMGAFLLSACDPRESPRSGEEGDSAAERVTSAPAEEAAEVCANCGTISAITPVTATGESSGAGAVIGAVAGGLLGNQVGGGSGKDAATAVGAVGGALAGNEVEKRKNATTYYKVTVDMNDGTRRVVNVNTSSGISVGSEVAVEGNDLRIL